MKRAPLVAASVSVLALGGYLAAWPVPIESVAWQAPEASPPHTEHTFPEAHRVALPSGFGPEDLEVDAQGRVYAGLDDGRILRWDSLTSPGEPTVVADTGGRPLGLHPDGAGGLYIADAFSGLLQLTASGELRTLATECAGEAFIFTDDLETDASGRVWFTDASTRHDQHHWKHDLLENRGAGRLCRYDPSTGQVELVLDGLHFANGVAIDPDQRFVLINETSRYRVRRYWLDDGRVDVLIDNLPGFPDGISTGTDGTFWIAIASPRNPLVDQLAPSPRLRDALLRLPDALTPAPEHTAHVLGVDDQGEVVHDLFDPAGTAIALVTSVQERDGKLLLGSLTDTAWAWLERP